MTDTGYSNFRWYIFITMIVVTAITSMGLIAPASVFPILFKSMPGLEPGDINWAAMGYFNFFMAIAAVFGGFLNDKLGPIKVFIGGLLLIMIGAFLMPVMGSTYYGMLFIRLLQGFGTGPIMAAVVPIAASYFPVNERGLATGAQGFAVSFGIIMGLQLFPRLAASQDVFAALKVLAWVAVIGIILSVIAAFGPKVAQEPVKMEQGSQDASASHLFKKALANPLTWIAILCFTFMSGIFQQLNSIVPGYIGADEPLGLGRGTQVGADALTVATILFCIGSFLSGPISEKLFGGKARPVIAIGFLLGAIGAFSMKYDFVASDQGTLTIAIAITAFFYSLVNPQAMAYLAKNYAQQIAGKLGGLTIFVGIMLGSTGAVLWLSKSLNATGNYMQPITIMAGLCLAGFVISLFLKHKSSTD